MPLLLQDPTKCWKQTGRLETEEASPEPLLDVTEKIYGGEDRDMEEK